MKKLLHCKSRKIQFVENEPNAKTEIRWALTKAFVVKYIRGKIRYARIWCGHKCNLEITSSMELI